MKPEEHLKKKKNYVKSLTSLMQNIEKLWVTQDNIKHTQYKTLKKSKKQKIKVLSWNLTEKNKGQAYNSHISTTQ